MTTLAETTDYVRLEELKATLELTNQTFADNDIQAAISAASRGIDEVCQRRFWADTTPVDRYYTPVTSQQVMIDDLYDFDALVTDQDGDSVYEQAWTLNTEFALLPLNAAADGWPYTTLRLHPRNTTGFPYWWPRSVKITGRFGWETVPAPVTEATTILATQLLKRAREAPFGIVSIGIDVGATARIAVTDPSVRFLLSPYMRERRLG